jgi:predicted peroxiredoxin
MMAMWAKESGMKAAIWLTDEAVLLVKKGYADNLKAPDYKPFKFYLDKVVEKKIKIYLCHLSMARRNLTEKDCVGNVVKSGAQRVIDEAKVGSVITF